MADEHVTDSPAVASRRRKIVRVFLMVAGGLAAPCLALAAFFLSSSGGSDTPTRPPAGQAGLSTVTPTQPRRAPATPAPSATAPTTASSTTAPAAPTGPLRDPFVPLVAPPSPSGTPPR